MRKVWGGSSWERLERAKLNGKQGGRPVVKLEPKPTPKPKSKPKPLTDRAAVINRLLLRDWIITDIADVLGVSRQAIEQVVARYELPRND